MEFTYIQNEEHVRVMIHLSGHFFRKVTTKQILVHKSQCQPVYRVGIRVSTHTKTSLYILKIYYIHCLILGVDGDYCNSFCTMNQCVRTYALYRQQSQLNQREVLMYL